MSKHPTMYEPHFNGPCYDPVFDFDRLTGQLRDIYDLMRDCRWRTLDEIADETGHPPASISAQLRHLRKPRFGSFIVDKQPRGERSRGLWEYRLRPQEDTTQSGSETKIVQVEICYD